MFARTGAASTTSCVSAATTRSSAPTSAACARIAASITSLRSTATMSTDGHSRRTPSAIDAPIRPKPTMAIR